MKTFLRRLIGMILVLTALGGMFFSVLGFLQVWRIRASLTEYLGINLQLMDTLLGTTNDSLVIIDNLLVSARDNINSLEATTQGLAKTLEDSEPMLDSLSLLVGEELPDTIGATQTSLRSAQTTALLIDNMLTTISRIPLLNLNRYTPQVPLNVALGEVSNSLGTLPSSLESINGSLKTAKSNLMVIETQVYDMGGEIAEISQSFDQARGSIDQYQEAVAQIQKQVDDAQVNLPNTLTDLAWTLSFLLVWLGLTQIGLLIQAIGLLSWKPG